MKKGLIFVLSILMFSSLVSAKVFINEVEFNPAGSDTGNEWVELYNNEFVPVNITGWRIVDKVGINTVPAGIIINATGFYVINSSHDISPNSNQNFSLLNISNGIIDQTVLFNDSSPSTGNNKTWQRVFDGNNIWQFQQDTMGIVNLDLVIPNITNQSRNLNPVFENDDLDLLSTIEENYLEEVKISGNWSGGWENFTVFSASANVTQRNFTYTVNKNELDSGEFVEWFYIAEDTSGNVGVGDKQNFTVRNITLVNITPSSPDGLNGYYVTVPLFNLISDNTAISSFYRFDSLQWNLFIGLFLFDINGTLGGIERMDFFSSFGNRNESLHNITIKVDVFKPELISMYPTGVIRTNNVNINALIDDKYQSNSGLNLNSLIMEVDNNTVNPNVTSLDSLKARVNYSASGLGEGNHNVNISIYDNAGNLGGGIWSFVVNTTNLILNVSSPINGNYGSNRVRFDIKTNIPGKISFIDNGEKENKLCTSCLNINKTFSLRDGQHNLTIKANGEQVNRSIFIDSDNPRIIKTLPKSKTYVNGTEFSVKYTEEFLNSINVIYGNGSLMFSTNLNNCGSGRNIICATDVDLSNFNGQAINFSFNVSDRIRGVSSKISTLFVDTSKPIIDINSPNGNQNRNVRIDLGISEIARDLSYIDFNDIRPSEKRLCRNCQYYNKTRSFRVGDHLVKFIAEDRAGNKGDAIVNFTVV